MARTLRTSTAAAAALLLAALGTAGSAHAADSSPVFVDFEGVTSAGSPTTDAFWIAASSQAAAITGVTMNYGDGTVQSLTAAQLPQVSHTFPGPGQYTVTGTATDADGNHSTGSMTITIGSAFVPVAPVRVLDTRFGTGAPKAKVKAGGVVRVQIAGAHGIPSKGVTAVTMNVTDTNATASSWITAYADGGNRPTASNLNFQAGQTNPNQVTVPVGKDGFVDLYNAKGSVDLFADIQGYFTSANATAATAAKQSYFVLSDPTLILDTRTTTGGHKGKVGPGGTVTVAALPPGTTDPKATAALVDISDTDATANSWITAHAGGSALPNASDLNFHTGQTTSNLVVVPVDSKGRIAVTNHSGSTDILVDVQGYYTTMGEEVASAFYPVAPTRVLDTRNGTGTAKKPLGAGGSVKVNVSGPEAPADAQTAVVNITASWPSVSTALTAYPDGEPVPNTVNIFPAPGQTRPVLAAVPGGTDPNFTLRNAKGTVDVFVDVYGYYVAN